MKTLIVDAHFRILVPDYIPTVWLSLDKNQQLDMFMHEAGEAHFKSVPFHPIVLGVGHSIAEE